MEKERKIFRDRIQELEHEVLELKKENRQQTDTIKEQKK